MSLNLAGSRVLITGATSGIGKETALLLSKMGCVVAVNGRRASRLEELVSEIDSSGSKAFAFPGDLTDPDVAKNVVDGAAETLGGIDICINSAGLLLTGPFAGVPTDEIDRMIEINFRGVLSITHAVVPHLVAAASKNKHLIADLVNISSAAGRRVVKNSAVYNATKWAVIGFSDTLRMELADKGVRVGLIEPGSVNTEIQNNIRPEIRAIPRPEFAGYTKLEAIDIAEAILFMVTRDRRAAVNELLIRPSQQIT